MRLCYCSLLVSGQAPHIGGNMIFLLKTLENINMASSPLNNGGGSDETSRTFCDHVNFSEMNGGISVYEGTKSNNHKEGVNYHY